jgi:hypothetical protein
MLSEASITPRSPLLQRNLLAKLSLYFSASSSVLLALNTPAKAQPTVTTLREDIANSAAKIPGFGPSNVIYPDVFEGVWAVDKEVYDISSKNQANPPTIDLIDAIRPFQAQGKHIEYTEQYVRYNGQVVQDRAVSVSSYARAVLVEPSILCRWEPNNPNLLTLSRPSGQVTEIRVTKRALENLSSQASVAVGYSEYCRVAQVQGGVDMGGGVPKLFAMRTLARIKQIEDDANKFTGVERMYIYAADTLDLGGEPLITIKSRFSMSRV